MFCVFFFIDLLYDSGVHTEYQKNSGIIRPRAIIRAIMRKATLILVERVSLTFFFEFFLFATIITS